MRLQEKKRLTEMLARAAATGAAAGNAPEPEAAGYGACEAAAAVYAAAGDAERAEAARALGAAIARAAVERVREEHDARWKAR